MAAESAVVLHGEMVHDLGRALSHGRSGLSSVRSLLQVVVREHAWPQFEIPGTRQVVTYQHDDFLRFVSAAPPEGLGTDVRTLEQLCVDDIAALAAIEVALQRPHGGPRVGSRAEVSHAQHGGQGAAASTGSRIGALRRLRQLRPGLHRLVLAGQLSANGALIKAGLRRPRVTVPVQPDLAARAIRHAFSAQELLQLMVLLAIGGSVADRVALQEAVHGVMPPDTDRGVAGSVCTGQTIMTFDEPRLDQQ